MDIEGETKMEISSDWLVGEPLMLASINGKDVTVQVLHALVWSCQNKVLYLKRPALHGVIHKLKVIAWDRTEWLLYGGVLAININRISTQLSSCLL